MDYSKNVFHNPADSNSSTRNDFTNTWKNLPLWKRIPIATLYLSKILFVCAVAIEMSIVTPISHRGWLPHWFHYPYQAFLKWFFITFNGIYTEIYDGDLGSDHIRFQIPQNIWFGYELSGDYEKYITKVSFVRNYRRFKKYNMFDQLVQNGWLIVFEFSQPPKAGSCKVEYV